MWTSLGPSWGPTQTFPQFEKKAKLGNTSQNNFGAHARCSPFSYISARGLFFFCKDSPESNQPSPPVVDIPYLSITCTQTPPVNYTSLSNNMGTYCGPYNSKVFNFSPNIIGWHLGGGHWSRVVTSPVISLIKTRKSIFPFPQYPCIYKGLCMKNQDLLLSRPIVDDAFQ